MSLEHIARQLFPDAAQGHAWVEGFPLTESEWIALWPRFASAYLRSQFPAFNTREASQQLLVGHRRGIAQFNRGYGSLGGKLYSLHIRWVPVQFTRGVLGQAGDGLVIGAVSCEQRTVENYGRLANDAPCFDPPANRRTNFFREFIWSGHDDPKNGLASRLAQADARSEHAVRHLQSTAPEVFNNDQFGHQYPARAELERRCHASMRHSVVHLQEFPGDLTSVSFDTGQLLIFWWETRDGRPAVLKWCYVTLYPNPPRRIESAPAFMAEFLRLAYHLPAPGHGPALAKIETGSDWFHQQLPVPPRTALSAVRTALRTLHLTRVAHDDAWIRANNKEETRFFHCDWEAIETGDGAEHTSLKWKWNTSSDHELAGKFEVLLFESIERHKKRDELKRELVLWPGESGKPGQNVRLNYSRCAHWNELSDLESGDLPLGRWKFSDGNREELGPRLFMGRDHDNQRLEKHGVVVSAAPGSGKTTFLLRWAESALKAGFSLFVVDVDGVLHDRLLPIMGRYAQRAYFFSTDPNIDSDCINFLQGFLWNIAVPPGTSRDKRKENREYRAIASRITHIAEVLLPDENLKDGDSQLFRTNRVLWLKAFIHVLKLYESLVRNSFVSKEADLGDLYDLIASERLFVHYVRCIRMAEKALAGNPAVGLPPGDGVLHWLRELQLLIDDDMIRRMSLREYPDGRVYCDPQEYAA